MKSLVCKKCVLDSGTKGVTINPDTGLCQFCEQVTVPSSQERENLKKKMDGIFASPTHTGKHDVILAISGGIDSCYALYRLHKEYPHLRILAVQFDNGFIPDIAFENAQKICDISKSSYFRIEIDHGKLCDTFKKAALSKDVYSESAKYRASDVCNTCMHTIKQKMIEIAIKTNTRYLIFAFSPGQTDAAFVPLTKPFITWSRRLFEKQLAKMGIEEKNLYLADEGVIASSPKDLELTIIHPYLIWDYNKSQFRKKCIELGWIPPDLSDPHSSNCLLNEYAIKNHLDKYNIHPYIHDIAALVRNGYLPREEALETLQSEFSEEAIKNVHKKLNS